MSQVNDIDIEGRLAYLQINDTIRADLREMWT